MKIVRVIDQIDIFKFITGNFQIFPAWRAPRSPTIGYTLGMGDAEYGKIRDIYSRCPTQASAWATARSTSTWRARRWRSRTRSRCSTASGQNIAFMLQDGVADGPYFAQEWDGMKQTTPIIHVRRAGPEVVRQGHAAASSLVAGGRGLP